MVVKSDEGTGVTYFTDVRCMMGEGRGVIFVLKTKIMEKLFENYENSSYLCSMKGTYLGWEPRLVRQVTH